MTTTLEIIENLSAIGIFSLSALICILADLGESLLNKITGHIEECDDPNELVFVIHTLLIFIGFASWLAAFVSGIGIVFEFLKYILG